MKTDKSKNQIITFVKEQLFILLSRCNLALLHEHDDQVVAYLCVLQAVTETAISLTLSLSSETRYLQETGSKAVVIKSEQTPQVEDSSGHHKTLQKSVDKITAEILKWHKNSHERLLCHSVSHSINAAGYALLEMLFRRKQRYEAIKESISSYHEQIYAHCEIMRLSFQRAAAAGTRTEQVKTALETALSMKMSITSTIPRMILVHDLDKNLAFDESYYSEFPNWKLFSKAKEIHDKYEISPWESRFSALSVFGVLNSETRELFFTLLKKLGKEISNLVFEDVRELFQQFNHFPYRSIECCIVTANNSTVASEVSRQLGWFPNRVWGVSESNCDGFDKAITLLEILYADPSAILICSDDSDSGLISSLREGSLFQDTDIHIQLPDLCFFAARCPTETESTHYDLHEVLDLLKIPFLINHAELHSSGKMYGYQGVNEYVRIYKDWIIGNVQ